MSCQKKCMDKLCANIVYKKMLFYNAGRSYNANCVSLTERQDTIKSLYQEHYISACLYNII